MKQQSLYYTMLLVLLFFARGGTVYGQTAQITGIVADSSGAVVPGTDVTVTNVDTGIKKITSTNQQGHYTVPLLNPGNYTVTIQKEGFKQINRSGIKLEVDQIGRIDFTLEVGEVSDSVSVDAEVPLLQSETAALGQVIGNKKILDLPLNGRDFTQLATLTPGAISRGASGFMQSPSLSGNGGRGTTTVFLIDGGDVSHQYFDGATVVPSVDAIQEFKVQSNSFAAEQGLGQAVVNVTLKSGTNDYHGSVYEFLRNDALDARNFFNTSGQKPPLRQNQFGFTMGGPLTIPRLVNGKDRTFFFGDYEGTRIIRPVTFNSVVPSAAMRSGDFSELGTPISDPSTTRPDPNRPDSFIRDPFPNNKIPMERLAPQALYFLQFYPLPNTSGGTFVFSPSTTDTRDRFDVRLDHRLSDGDSLSGSYSFNRSLPLSPGQFPANGQMLLDIRKQRVSINYNHSFNAQILNELRLGYVRSRFVQTQQGAGTNHTVLSGIGGFEEHSKEFPGFPGLNISNFLGFNENAFRPIKYRDNKYEIVNNFAWLTGKHAFKMGVDLRRFDTATTNAARSRGGFNFTGTYTSHSFADFLLGLPFSAARSFPRNLFGHKPISNEHFFFQDDWKVSPNLTLNLGLRYELNHPPQVLHNQAASTEPVLQRIVVASDKNRRITVDGQQVGRLLLPLFADVIVPSSQAIGISDGLIRLDKNNFAPRLGLAWRARGKDLVVRAGYGIFYTLINANRLESTAIVNPPFLADELANFNTTPLPTKSLANMFPSISEGLNLLPLSFFQMDPDARDPYIQQWNLTLQKAIGNVLSLEGSYVGSKATKLGFSRPINVPSPGPGPIQGRRLWTRFAQGTSVENSGGSTYNAFQSKVEIKSWRGLSWLASYALAKSIDNLSGDVQGFQAQDPDNSHAEKGISDFDVKHRLVVSANYALPFGKEGGGLGPRLVRGWEIGSIVIFQTGLPFTPSISTDTANTGTTRRPDRIGKGTVDNRTLDRDFDPAAFKVPAPLSYGNSGRNILYSRGFKNWDFVLLRNFKFRERVELQFRAEFFNFTNTPAFGSPVSNIQSSNVGRILSAGEPRDIQFGLKLSF